MEKITVKEIPDWFNLENYKNAKNLTAMGWYSQLVSRRGLYNQVSDLNAYNQSVDEDQRYKLKDFISIGAANIYENIKKNGLLSNVDEVYPYHKVFNNISSLSIRDCFSIETELSVIKTKEHLEQLKKIHEKEMIDIDSDIKNNTLLSKPLNEILDFGNDQLVKINLSASDEKIISDIKDWLKEKRNEHKKNIYTKKNYTQIHFDKWISKSVLPYLDLTIWAKMESKSISYNVMGKTIFPNEYDIDLAEKVRKTVSDLALSLITRESLVMLGSQIIREE